MQDRDWYRDLKREEEGLPPRRRGLNPKPPAGFYPVPQKPPPEPWHPLLRFLRVAAWCFVVYVLLKFYIRFR
jgi:hypothetical protein